jgi:hypothetical protein
MAHHTTLTHLRGFQWVVGVIKVIAHAKVRCCVQKACTRVRVNTSCNSSWVEEGFTVGVSGGRWEVMVIVMVMMAMVVVVIRQEGVVCVCVSVCVCVCVCVCGGVHTCPG